MLGTAGLVNILVLAWLMFHAKRAFPAYVFASVGSLVMLLPTAVGHSSWWPMLANALFKM